jgi:hypothetical protein
MTKIETMIELKYRVELGMHLCESRAQHLKWLLDDLENPSVVDKEETIQEIEHVMKSGKLDVNYE